MTYSDLLLIHTALQQIANLALPIRVALAIARNTIALRPHIDAFNMARSNCTGEEAMAELLQTTFPAPVLERFALPETEDLRVPAWVLSILLQHELLDT